MRLSGILSLWNQSEPFKEIIKIIKKDNQFDIDILGLNESATSMLISALNHKSEKMFLIVTDTQEHALRTYQDMHTFLGASSANRTDVLLFPSFDVLPYEDIAPDPQIVQKRINTLKELALYSKAKNNRNKVLIADIKALLPKLASPKSFKKSSWTLQVGSLLKKDDLIQMLVEQKYRSVEIVEEIGEFSSRGGIVDFFPIASENPIRLELFGDQIESLRYFSPSTQRSLEKMGSYELFPFQKLANEAVSNDHYSTLFNYLPLDATIISMEKRKIKEKIEEFQEEMDGIYFEKKKDLGDSLLPPATYFIFWPEVSQYLKKNNALNFSYFPEKNIKNKNSKLGKKKTFFFKTQEINSYFGNLDLLTKDIREWQGNKKNIIIFAKNEGRAKRLAEILEERGVKKYVLNNMEKYDIGERNIFITFGYFSRGFRLFSPEVFLITDNEIFGKERKKRVRLATHKSLALKTIMDISADDYVVHVDHGVGIYRGVINKNIKGIKQDYLFIEYASGDKLFVPVDQFNLVHKYVGMKDKTPKVHRLGGVSWGNTKKRVKRSIKKMAQELYLLYVARKKVKGFAFSIDNNWQQELEMSFPFEETVDQLKALSEVKSDMEIARPMERLVCGDVGYGKTEIAMRAAFKAVMDGKQVAILAPTTILVQQHHDTFSERMNAFPVNIDMLSRFRSKKEQKNILQKLQKGKVDIIIGTHRLVQKDVEFKDLGLLIVDEEQRFGVLHKERIKKMKENIDSLTLTATPIPRTLHMSLIGARDLSVISTPPENRFPVATYISKRDNRVIIDAVRRELDREGQIYFVHNRVMSIYKIARELNRMIPSAKIGIAHGQMAEEELEDVMIDFLEKRYDILVCTTIIEIGLDIPNVNTIIIDNAHRFGLSQLYQLRGRVGRTDRRAYAYFLYPELGTISETARKRLQAIKEFNDLGSGFKLAMRDLEIRGAGNLLGKEQHGFVAEIGFNLYCSLLEEAINDLKEMDTLEQVSKTKKVSDSSSIEIKMDAYIPEKYIPSLEQRVMIYQKLARIDQIEELEEVKDELRDRYGIFSHEVENLLGTIWLKIYLQQLSIHSMTVDENKLIFRYKNSSEMDKKISGLPFMYKKRIDDEHSTNKGIFEMNISDIKNSEILKFLKEFMIELKKTK